MEREPADRRVASHTRTEIFGYRWALPGVVKPSKTQSSKTARPAPREKSQSEP
jgi:hypothetical protein